MVGVAAGPKPARSSIALITRIAAGALAFRAVSAFLAFLCNLVFPLYQPEQFPSVFGSMRAFWDPFTRYDGGWYYQIARNGYAFVVGGSYLVYAYQATGSTRLTTGICSRTQPLSQAAADLGYMRSLPATGAQGATISGSVHHRDRNVATKSGATLLAPVGSLGVVMECDGAAYRGTTDADGRFTIAGIPVGSCTPRLESPGDDFLLTVNTINIPDPRACADVSLLIGARKK